MQQKIHDAIVKPYRKRITYVAILTFLMVLTAIIRFILEFFELVSSAIGTAIGFIISVPLLLVFTFLYYQLISVLSDNRRLFLALLAGSLIPAIYMEMQFVFTWMSFSISSVLILLVGNIGLYLVYGAVDIFEIRRKRFWSIAFILVVLTGLAVILLPESAFFPNVAVEIIGAFLGVMAALILGELMKEYEREKQGKDLSREIETELADISNMLGQDENVPIPFPVWTSSLMSGSLMTISSDARRFLTLVYKEIEIYNYRRTHDQKKKALAYAKLGTRLLEISREGFSKMYLRDWLRKQIAKELLEERLKKGE